MPLDRMARAILQGKNWNFFEVVFRQLYFAVEDRDERLAFHWLRFGRIRSVAFQAERVDIFYSQQVLVIAAVRLVAGGATFLEGWLVMNFFGFEHVRLIGMAGQANLHAIGF